MLGLPMRLWCRPTGAARLGPELSTFKASVTGELIAMDGEARFGVARCRADDTGPDWSGKFCRLRGDMLGCMDILFQVPALRGVPSTVGDCTPPTPDPSPFARLMPAGRGAACADVSWVVSPFVAAVSLRTLPTLLRFPRCQGDFISMDKTVLSALIGCELIAADGCAQFVLSDNPGPELPLV
eukprot:SAG31_NODE_11595_length_1015_cov_0.898472_1_plen_182_part_10